MKTTITLTSVLAALAVLSGCGSMPSAQPAKSPTAENGGTHGALTKPSTASH